MGVSILTLSVFLASNLLLGACATTRGAGGRLQDAGPAAGDLRVWSEFVDLLRAGSFPADPA